MKKLITILCIVLVVIPFQLRADQLEGNGKITGTVLDDEARDPMVGASVAVLGTSLGTVVMLDGSYTINNVPAGKYTLVVRYIGYEEIRKDAEVKANETTKVDFLLRTTSIMGEEVIIKAQAKGQMAAINQQLAADNITNIVSADKLKEVPDVNAAESIGRLPGVSLTRSGGEGNKVLVRGLAPRFTIIEMDGVRLTGIDADRSVGLTNISSEMLGGIELSKSLTADKDADAIGGVINLRSKVAEDGFHYNIMAQNGYNNLEQSFNNYKFAGSISNRFFDNSFGVLLNVSHERVIRSSDRLSAGLGRDSRVDQGDTLYRIRNDNLRISENKSYKYRPQGNLVLDYKNEFMSIKFNNFYSHMTTVNEIRNNLFRFSSSDFHLDISRNEPVEITRTHSLNAEFKIKNTKLNVDISHTNTEYNTDNDVYIFRQDAKDAIKPEFTNHAIPNDKFGRIETTAKELIDKYYDVSKIDKAYLYNNFRDTVNRLDKTYTAKLDWEVPYNLGNRVSGFIKVGAKYVSKNRKSDKETKESYYHGGIGDDRMERVYAKNPDFLRPGDIPGYTGIVGIPALNFEDPDYNYGEVLKGEYNEYLTWSPDLGKLREVHDYSEYPSDQVYRLGVPSSERDYDNTEERIAAYIMAKVNIGKKLVIIPGVRFEKMNTEYRANILQADPFAKNGTKIGYPIPITTNRNNQYFFPSVNSKYSINNSMDIRAAYYRSTSRPNYLSLSPGMVVDEKHLHLRGSNPYLEPSVADNFDLGFSVYTNKFGLFTLNLFYKEITGLERGFNYYHKILDETEDVPHEIRSAMDEVREMYPEVFFDSNGLVHFAINNPESSYYQGFEVSWQTNLSSFTNLPKVVQGFVFDFNYSHIWSETVQPYLIVVDGGWSDDIIPKPIDKYEYRTETVEMTDQPRDLFNARVGWDYRGFSSRVSFRFQGGTLRQDVVFGVMDLTYRPEYLLDVNISQRINERLTLSLDGINLTRYREMSAYEDAVEGETFESRNNFYDMTIQFALRFRL